MSLEIIRYTYEPSHKFESVSDGFTMVLRYIMCWQGHQHARGVPPGHIAAVPQVGVVSPDLNYQ